VRLAAISAGVFTVAAVALLVLSWSSSSRTSRSGLPCHGRKPSGASDDAALDVARIDLGADRRCPRHHPVDRAVRLPPLGDSSIAKFSRSYWWDAGQAAEESRAAPEWDPQEGSGRTRAATTRLRTTARQEVRPPRIGGLFLEPADVLICPSRTENGPGARAAQRGRMATRRLRSVAAIPPNTADPSKGFSVPRKGPSSLVGGDGAGANVLPLGKGIGKTWQSGDRSCQCRNQSLQHGGIEKGHLAVALWPVAIIVRDKNTSPGLRSST